MALQGFAHIANRTSTPFEVYELGGGNAGQSKDGFLWDKSRGID
jgi:hypothetical protein